MSKRCFGEITNRRKRGLIMTEVLLKLKRILNAIPDKELKDYELWIDGGSTIDAIIVENNDITLVRENQEIKIDGLVL